MPLSGKLIHLDGTETAFIGACSQYGSPRIRGKIEKLDVEYDLVDAPFKQMTFLGSRESPNEFHWRSGHNCHSNNGRVTKGTVVLETWEGLSVTLKEAWFGQSDYCYGDLYFVFEDPITGKDIVDNILIVPDEVQAIVFNGQDQQSQLIQETRNLLARAALPGVTVRKGSAQDIDPKRVEEVMAYAEPLSTLLEKAGYSEASLVLDLSAATADVSVLASEQNWKGVSESLLQTAWGFLKPMMTGATGVVGMVSEPAFKDGKLMMKVNLPVSNRLVRGQPDEY